MDISENEAIAIEYGATMAGEYLDEIGITDLTLLSGEQWKCFTDVMCINYSDKLVELNIGN